ncbi:phosphocarrier protein HPr domain protein [Enterococcus sp. H57]|uniref:phosphocarrier protein HPr domain protein n=1 Tax=Enterococcus sp. H57 TaxID=2035004 RepID=UPI000D59127B|nr:phosphocarrier protein HPr domain protein [Enterococcus sp. H57]
MVGMTIFWSVMGAALAIFGFYLINHTNKRGKDCTVLGITLLTVGILIAVGAELNLYVNGTQEDLVWFMFWTRN